MKQVLAYRSRQHLVPSLRVQSGRPLVTRSTPVLSSYDSDQAKTTPSIAKPHRITIEALQAEHQAFQQQQMRRRADFEARMEELRRQQAPVFKAAEELLRRVPVEVTRIRRVALEVLVRVCGKQENGTTPSALFAQLVEAKDSGLQRVADSLGMELEQLGEEAKAMLAHHDGSPVELSDMEDLDLEAWAMGIWIQAFKQSYPREYHFMEAYEAIKQAVPERFK